MSESEFNNLKRLNKILNSDNGNKKVLEAGYTETSVKIRASDFPLIQELHCTFEDPELISRLKDDTKYDGQKMKDIRYALNQVRATIDSLVVKNKIAEYLAD